MKQCLQCPFFFFFTCKDSDKDNVAVPVLVALPQIVSDLANKSSDSGFLQQSDFLHPSQCGSCSADYLDRVSVDLVKWQNIGTHLSTSSRTPFTGNWNTALTDCKSPQMLFPAGQILYYEENLADRFLLLFSPKDVLLLLGIIWV